ncbi:patatin-like phospholipase family protein [Leucobacter viscericola]|uniref:Patatin-like phospholipase family protein n=1 Tax=Leucobacter viscericola TaxID=2714935 RepID=A0A6G7XG06_9MICO|nr:patatin-like phospholipase family protein [Leucobacter viscericola]QIK63483.1 patatin-like phospholipase family protein [Leucobacter viscericola]
MHTTSSSTHFVTSRVILDAQAKASYAPLENHAGKRALVLGGGGSAGNAWLIGVLAGLAQAGLDVTETDLMVGTSAGATAAAQLGGASAAQLFENILAATLPQPRTAAVGGSGASSRQTSNHMERTAKIIAAAENPTDMRRGMGSGALEMAEAWGEDGRSSWRRTVAARFSSQDWPECTTLLTAVDAGTGEPVVFDSESGVDLADAVAASCSAATAYSIGGRGFIDGGYRRNENADLAAGFERVLVLSPFGGRTRHPLEWNMQLAAQVDELRSGGSAVETIAPDPASLEAFGTNMMDLSTRIPAARAGHGQGEALAPQLAEFWG